MIKMLIADDEYIILESLKNLVDWQSIGVEVIGTADNGAATLDFTFKHQPDIILSDISMPLFSGLEMLEALRKKNIDTEVIFISAHSKFEYAQEALKHGAFDYILKPLSELLLLETVQRCAEKMIKKRDGSRSVWSNHLESGASQYHEQIIGIGANPDYVSAQADLLQAVKTGDEEGVKVRLPDVFAGLVYGEDIYDANLMKLKFVELLNHVLRELDDYRLPDYLGSSHKVLDAKKCITAAETFDETAEATRNMIINITLCIKEILSSGGKKLVSLTVALIQENYQKEISLSQIAGHLYISPAYLSHIFSAEMKIPFSHYLRNYRIDVAKKLLRESRLKIYEVAAQVGSPDVAHFSKTFKQITGVTPIHYREDPHM